MKIHILGGMGSGKTTLAKALAAHFSIPHHDLDQTLWRHGSRQEAFIEEAFAISAQPDWVSEGIFLVWIDPLLYQADVIVHIEVSWIVAIWRIVRRHVRLSIQRRNPYPTRLLYPFLLDTYRYYCRASDASALKKALAGQGEDAGPPQRERLLQRLESANASLPLAADFTRRYLEKYQEKVRVVRNRAGRDLLMEKLTTRREYDRAN